jgi:hypothetical protein
MALDSLTLETSFNVQDFVKAQESTVDALEVLEDGTLLMRLSNGKRYQYDWLSKAWILF